MDTINRIVEDYVRAGLYRVETSGEGKTKTLTKEELFHAAWGDYSVYDALCNGDITKFKELDKTYYKTVLNQLLFIKSRNEINNYLANRDKPKK